MSEKRTKVILEAQAKGFEKAAAQAKKTTDAMVPPKTALAGHESLEKSMQKQIRAQQQLARELEKTARARQRATEQGLVAEARAVQKQKQLKQQALEDGLLAEAKYLQKQREQANRATQDAQKAAQRRSTAFSRGILQGSGLGEYFPEENGPELRRNLAGRLVGGAARRAGGFAAGVASMPFSGAGGMMNALGSLGAPGAFVGAQLNNGLAAAQDALAFRQQQFGALSGMVPGSEAGIQRAGGLAAARVRIPGMNPDIIRAAGEEGRRRAERQAGGRTWGTRVNALGFSEVTETTPSPEDAIRTAAKAGDAAAAGERTRQQQKIAEAQGKRAAARANGERGALGAQFGDMIAAGGRLGMSPQEAVAAGTQFQNASGMGLGRGGSDNMRAALAAQKRYGVDIGTSGMLARGERSGALGSDQGFGQSLMGGIRTAAGLGLGGDDVTRYLQDIAERVGSFESTGIPVAQESLGQLQMGFAAAVGPLRGIQMGKQLLATAQNIGNEGPTSAAQLLAFRTMGGYSGGGIDDFYDASKRMETANFAEGGVEQMIKRASAGINSPKGKAIAVRNFMQQLGVRGTLADAEDLINGKTGKFSAQLKAGVEASENVAPLGTFSAPGVLQTEAERERQKLNAGDPLIKVMQNLEKVSANMLTNVSKFSKELQSATGWAAEASTRFMAAVSSFEEFVRGAQDRAARGQ